LAFLGPRLAIGPTAEALGAQPEFTDIGNAFEKAAEVAAYVDAALARVVAGNSLPDPPRITGDVTAARVAWGWAIGSAALFVAVSLAASRQHPRAFARSVGLGKPDVDGLWVPALAVAVVYLASGAYIQAVEALEIDVLLTEPGGLEVTLRDTWAIVLYGVTTVVAAPLGEEFFYRGLVFSGLARWGFFPAALVSSALFALSHVDAATMVPFTVAGLTMCWLYWRSGSLWDAIAFHVLFNLLSFILLMARV
jgi:membrane protease YdiL (CAAX protease family)